MASIDEIYKGLLKLIRKNQAGGLSAGEFNYFWNAGQFAYFSDLLGRFQRNSNGKEGNNTGLIENATILTKLTPFTKTTNIAVAAGLITRPTDFLYKLAMRSGGYAIMLLHHDQQAALTDEAIDPPSVSANAYYAVEIGRNYQIFPAAASTVDLDYVAAPTPVKWAYGFDSNNRQVYDPVNSVQSQWDDGSNQEITERILKQLGVSFQSRDFSQFGQTIINSGS